MGVLHASNFLISLLLPRCNTFHVSRNISGIKPMKTCHVEANTIMLDKEVINIERKNVVNRGKITLLDSILSNIPIYFMSFYKAPK